MKKNILFITLIIGFFSKLAFSQNCFEITNILADACGTPEELNEMVRFEVGNSPLLVSTMNVVWPNIGFLGICQNANTAQKVADLNATIISCGYLLEPTADVLPANSTVILITSENVNTLSNSFANLTDTIYLIFQCGNQSQAHFRNYSPTLLTSRTLVINFGATCTDTVTYYPNQLVNQFGLLDTAAQDGSSIAFDSTGNPTYYNNGCQAPIITLNAAESISADTTCPGSLLTLTASNLSGNYSSYFWSGGNGVIASPNLLVTGYQTSATFTGVDYIEFAMVGQCNDTIRDSVAVFIQNGTAVTISGPATLCAGDTITLIASNSSTYLWSTGQTTASINVTQPGTYTVTVSGACGTSSANYTVTGGTSAPVITVTPGTSVTFCAGQSVTLSATGASSFLWSTGSTSSSISVNTAGVYTVSASNSCGTDSVQITVTQSSAASVNITSSNGTALCTGQSTTLTANATGATGYTWSGGQTSASINVNTPGAYTVTISTTNCGTATATQVITGATFPSAQISSGTTIICPGGAVTLTASGGTSYTWSTGASGNSISVTQPGTYKTFVTNACGTDSTTIALTASNVNASFTADPLTGFAPLLVNFTNTSIFNVTNNWNLGDGNTANPINTQNTYLTSGLYTVTLTVTDSGNCTSSANAIIEVLEDSNSIFIPNVITPNGDGKNDFFSIIGSAIRYTDVDIYNRWGQLIKQYSRYATGTEIGWDASNVKDGVYYYVINIGFKNGDSKTVKGSVTVVH